MGVCELDTILFVFPGHRLEGASVGVRDGSAGGAERQRAAVPDWSLADPERHQRHAGTLPGHQPGLPPLPCCRALVPGHAERVLGKKVGLRLVPGHTDTGTWPCRASAGDKGWSETATWPYRYWYLAMQSECWGQR